LIVSDDILLQISRINLSLCEILFIYKNLIVTFVDTISLHKVNHFRLRPKWNRNLNRHFLLNEFDGVGFLVKQRNSSLFILAFSFEKPCWKVWKLFTLKKNSSRNRLLHLKFLLNACSTFFQSFKFQEKKLQYLFGQEKI
jgi:hypothetical protein